LTPTNTGDVWSLGFAIADVGAISEPIKYRMQVDDADQPATQTSDDYIQLDAWDATDELPFGIQTIENMTSSSTHSLELNATKVTTARPVEDRLVLMVTMELQTVDNTSTKNDPMSMTDDINTHVTKVFNDTMSMPDNQTSNITKVFNDTMSMPDDIRTDVTKTFNDPMSMTDNINTHVTKVFNDTMSMPDSVNTTKTQLVIKDDPMSMTDDINTHVTKVFNDQMSITDTTTESQSKTFNDPMSMTDQISLTRTIATQPIVGGGAGSPTPTIPDSDQDGILDTDDQCDLQPEDFDNFEDADGCPEDGVVQPPPEVVEVPDITDFIPFEFNQLDVIDDYIKLETKSPQPQIETLSIRWLGAKPITISSVQLGQSPFEIQIQDIPVEFGNNRFGFTETDILYTVQEPDKICT
ncbi:MAG: hypothetical protein ACREJC_12320, partial [Tepidisphaeraceae bacterium]